MNVSFVRHSPSTSLVTVSYQAHLDVAHILLICDHHTLLRCPHTCFEVHPIHCTCINMHHIFINRKKSCYFQRSCWSGWGTFTGSMRDTKNNMAFFCGGLVCRSQLCDCCALWPLLSLEASMLCQFSWSLSFIVSTLLCNLASESVNHVLKNLLLLFFGSMKQHQLKLPGISPKKQALATPPTCHWAF